MFSVSKQYAWEGKWLRFEYNGKLTKNIVFEGIVHLKLNIFTAIPDPKLLKHVF